MDVGHDLARVRHALVGETASLLFVAAVVLAMLAPLLTGQRFLWGGDIEREHWPFREQLRRALLAGELPLWEPGILLGFPATAVGEMSVFYLPSLILSRLLDTQSALIGLWALHYLVAGASAYALSRVLGHRPAGAAVAGITFSCTGFFAASADQTHVLASACWLPLLVLAAELIARRQTYGRVAFAGGILGVMLVAGFFQNSLNALLFLGGYLVLRLAPPRPANLVTAVARASGLWLAIVVVGLLLAAVQLVPLVELLGFSTKRVVTPEYANEYVYGWHHLVELLLPTFYESAGGSWSTWNLSGTASLYFGTTALQLGVMALLLRPGDRQSLAFASLGVIAFLLALGDATPLWPALRLLPGFASARAPARFTLLVSLCAAMLAGGGMTALMNREASHATRARRAAVLLVSGSFALGLSLFVARYWLAAHPEDLQALVRDWYLGQRGVPSWVDESMVRDGIMDASLNLAYAPTAAAVAGAVASAALIAAALWQPRMRVGLRAALVILVGVQGWLFARDFRDAQPAELVGRPYPVVELLRPGASAGGWRVLANVPAIPPEYPNGFMVADIPAVDGYADLPPERTLTLVELARTQRAALRRLLGVRYVLEEASDPPAGRPVPAGGAVVFQDERLRVLELPSFLPRGFGVARVERADSPESARSILVRADFDPAQTAVILGAGGSRVETFSRPAEVRIVSYAPRQIRLAVDAPPEGGFVVLADAMYPGWTATGPGGALALTTANLALRGIQVPGGSSQVELGFDPVSLKIGAALSLVGLAFVVGCWLLALRSASVDRAHRARSRPAS